MERTGMNMENHVNYILEGENTTQPHEDEFALKEAHFVSEGIKFPY